MEKQNQWPILGLVNIKKLCSTAEAGTAEADMYNETITNPVFQHLIQTSTSLILGTVYLLLFGAC